MKRHALLVAMTLLLGAPTGARGQEPPGAPSQEPDTTRFTLVGRVADMSTGLPIIAAVIKFPDLKRIAYSNLDGIFELEDFPAGEWHLIIEQLGYHTSETDAVLAPGNGVQVHLRPDPVALEGFRVRTRSERVLDERSRKIPYRVVTIGPDVFAEAIQVDLASIFRGRSDA
ncbi:MAG: carboxypeptidase-like regulatory domain-containing protein, partial [Gemmatimonadota bacterium]|nr:carboxypeptidase-like regulatory domain-containing protein [Gemmatimonadota bacterium]